MKNKEDKKNISYLLVVFTIVWIWFMFMITIPNIKNDLQFCSYFFGKQYEEKMKVLDGDFYGFMQFCKVNIPEDKSIFFYNEKGKYEKSHGEGALLMAAKHREKAGYYLYPRAVYVPPYFTKIKNEISYVILDGVAAKIDGFEPFVEYSPNQRILRRIKADSKG